MIGHELGHFIGEDTAYSQHFAPIYAVMEHSINHVSATHGDGLGFLTYPSLYLGVFFLSQFDIAVNHWSRVREYAADQIGAKASNAKDVSSSLLRISASNVAVESVLKDFYKQELITDDLVASLFDRVKQSGIPDASEFLDKEFAHPTDTHPTTKARIEALNEPVSEALLARASRGVDALVHEHLSYLFEASQLLSMQLTQRFARVIGNQKAERKQQLQQMVDGVGERLEIRDTRFLFWLLALISAGSIAATGYLTYVTLYLEGLNASIKHSTFFAPLFGLLIVVFVLWRLSRVGDKGKVPLLVFTKETVDGFGMKSPFLLHHVDDYQITTHSTNGVTTHTTIRFLISNSAPAPALHKGQFGVKFKKKSRGLEFYYYGSIKVDGKRINRKKLSEHIHQYLAAAHAAQALKE